MAVDDAASIPANRRKDGKKPPDDSDGGSSSPPPHCSRQGKLSNHHGWKDSPPLQNRRREEGYSPKRHHRSHCKGHFTREIEGYPIPRIFAKLSKMETYDGTTNANEHVEHLDIVLDYHQAWGAVKCKLFALTLKGATMTWFKGLEDNSINSWKELCNEFTTHFTARRKQLKTMAALNTTI